MYYPNEQSIMNNVATAWIGIDVDLETSLFEYGFVCRQNENRDYPDEWQVLHMIDETNFDTGYVRESELDAIVKGEEWADVSDVEQFLRTMGMDNVNDWMNLPIQHKLSDIATYWGMANVMGTSYYPLGRQWAMDLLEGKE